MAVVRRQAERQHDSAPQNPTLLKWRGLSAVTRSIAACCWSLPGTVTRATATGFYANNNGNDISVHANLNASGALDGTVTANTLADLTRRECRFAHDPTTFPYACNWGQLGLPTLAECSCAGWTVGGAVTVPSNKTTLDFWSNRTSTSNTDSYPWADTTLGTGTRVSDDIILNNVIGFDVKAWDPAQKAYVDLGNVAGGTGLSGAANNKSGLTAVYDTWSTTYDGDKAHDGLDNDNNGIVDDDGERTNPPPYAIPLRGIQVKIRAFEPDSKQIREVTVVQDFLPQ